MSQDLGRAIRPLWVSTYFLFCHDVVRPDKPEGIAQRFKYAKHVAHLLRMNSVQRALSAPGSRGFLLETYPRRAESMRPIDTTSYSATSDMFERIKTRIPPQEDSLYVDIPSAIRLRYKQAHTNYLMPFINDRLSEGKKRAIELLTAHEEGGCLGPTVTRLGM